jgi:benzylsuccinate CoA-transferase BbsF subunit
LRLPAPRLGEHTAQVCAEWLASDRSAPAAPLAPARASERSAELPLTGLKVADFSWVVAGPVIGRALADFGATVVRIESATRIETARMMQPFYDGKLGEENSALYGTCNAGKYGMTVNLKEERGRAIARDAARWADVVIESFAPGQMAQWGLDYESLHRENPSLVMLSTSLTGQTGPSARLAGYGNIGAALSGYQDLVGWPDRSPIGPFGPYTDYVGPRFALVAVLAALDRVRSGGPGCYLDIAQSEIGAYLLSPQLARYFDTGEVAKRMGNRDEVYAPHGVYPCAPEDGADRFVAVAVCDDRQWTALARVIGRADLVSSTRFATVDGRRREADELDDVITAWTSGRTAAAVEAILQGAGVPAHVCASSADWCADPQLAHRGHLRALPHPRFGTATVEGPRYLLSDTPGVVSRPAPELGQHNEYVLRSILGYSESEYRDIVQSGVLA